MKKLLIFCIVSFNTNACLAQDTLRTAKMQYKVNVSMTHTKSDIQDIYNNETQQIMIEGNLTIDMKNGLYHTLFTTKDANPKISIRNENEKYTVELQTFQGLSTARVTHDSLAEIQMLIIEKNRQKVTITFIDSTYIINDITTKKAYLSSEKPEIITEVYYAPSIALPQLSDLGKQNSGLYFLNNTFALPYLVVKGKSVIEKTSIMQYELEKIDLNPHINDQIFGIPPGFKIL